jgi:nucleoside diphosphate kinase
MAWYDNATVAAILGGLVGAIVTAGVSVFIWQKTNKIKRVDCIVNDASSLLSFADTIRNELEVTYAGERANSVVCR